MYSQQLSKVLEMAVATSSAREVMRCFMEVSAEKIEIANILYFRVNAENRIELVSSYGESLALLEDYKFISRDRKLPVSEAINSGKEIYFDCPEQLVARYEEVRNWREIPASFAAIPVSKFGVTIGCAVFAFDQAIESVELKKTIETLRAFAYLLELLKVHEFAGMPNLLGLSHAPVSSNALAQQTNKLDSVGSRANLLQLATDLDLTERQLQIAVEISKGTTNSAIARMLGFSDATIRYETVKLYERLRVKNRSQASSRIRELGIA